MLLVIIIIFVIVVYWWIYHRIDHFTKSKDIAINTDGTPDPWGRTPEEVVETERSAAAHFYGTYDDYWCDDPRVEKIRREKIERRDKELDELKINDYLRQQREGLSYVPDPHFNEKMTKIIWN